MGGSGAGRPAAPPPGPRGGRGGGCAVRQSPRTAPSPESAGGGVPGPSADVSGHTQASTLKSTLLNIIRNRVRPFPVATENRRRLPRRGPRAGLLPLLRRLLLLRPLRGGPRRGPGGASSRSYDRRSSTPRRRRGPGPGLRRPPPPPPGPQGPLRRSAARRACRSGRRPGRGSPGPAGATWCRGLLYRYSCSRRFIRCVRCRRLYGSFPRAAPPASPPPPSPQAGRPPPTSSRPPPPPPPPPGRARRRLRARAGRGGADCAGLRGLGRPRRCRAGRASCGGAPRRRCGGRAAREVVRGSARAGGPRPEPGLLGRGAARVRPEAVADRRIRASRGRGAIPRSGPRGGGGPRGVRSRAGAWERASWWGSSAPPSGSWGGGEAVRGGRLSRGAG